MNLTNKVIAYIIPIVGKGTERGGNGNIDGSLFSQWLSIAEQAHPGFRKLLESDPSVHPFDLEDALDDPYIGDEVAQYGYPTSKTRRDFGEKQVRGPDQIEPGHYYRIRSVDGRSDMIKVTGIPREVTDRLGYNKWLIDCMGTDSYGEPRGHVYLSDVGVTPIIGQSGEIFWHAWNWLEKAEVEKVKLRLRSEENEIPVRNSARLPDLLTTIEESKELPRELTVFYRQPERGLNDLRTHGQMPTLIITDGTVIGTNEYLSSPLILEGSFMYWRYEDDHGRQHFMNTTQKLSEVRGIAKAVNANSLQIEGVRKRYAIIRRGKVVR